MSDRRTVAEALQRHYVAHGLPVDGGHSAEQWALNLGPLDLSLENFQWRRRALQHHDIHHVLTGYACTATGEMEVAAWEFAAGPFPSLPATLFCLPLVGAGALMIPQRSFAAFVRGRRSKTLYSMLLGADLMATEVNSLRARVLPAARPSPTLRDIAAYLLLVALSLALVIAPVAAIVAIVALW